MSGYEQRLNRHSVSRRTAGGTSPNEQFTNRRVYSRREAIIPHFGGGGGVSGDGCGDCSTFAGELTVDLTFLETAFYAAEYYRWNPFCNGQVDILFRFDPGSSAEVGIWLPTVSSSLECVAESTVAFTAYMQVTSGLPGDVKIFLSDGTNTWHFEAEVAWQGDQNTPMLLSSGPQGCPCAPFKQFPCLRPVPPPEE